MKMATNSAKAGSFSAFSQEKAMRKTKKADVSCQNRLPLHPRQLQMVFMVSKRTICACFFLFSYRNLMTFIYFLFNFLATFTNRKPCNAANQLRNVTSKAFAAFSGAFFPSNHSFLTLTRMKGFLQ